jgi:hypothetical protein
MQVGKSYYYRNESARWTANRGSCRSVTWTTTDRVAQLVFTLAERVGPIARPALGESHADEIDHVPQFLAAPDLKFAVDGVASQVWCKRRSTKVPCC